MKKEKAPEVDYSEALQKDPPDGVLQHLLDKGYFDEEYLVYRAAWHRDPLTGISEKCVKVTCTKCGNSFLADYIGAGGCHSAYMPAPFGYLDPTEQRPVISGESVLCPNCGAYAKTVHISNMNYGMNKNAYCTTFGRLGENLVVYGWQISRKTDKEGKHHWAQYPYEAYVVDKRKITRLTGYQRCLSTLTMFGHWEQRKTMLDKWGAAGDVLPWDPDLLKGSVAENSALDLYMDAAGKQAYPVTYLRIWKKHPQVENLVRQGAGKLLGEIIAEKQMYDTNYYGNTIGSLPKLEELNWKTAKPAQILGLDKVAFKWCCADSWTYREWEAYKALAAAGEKMDIHTDMLLIREWGTGNIEEILANEHRGTITVMRILRYLDKQKKKATNDRERREVRWGTLRDYWRLAAEAGKNLRDTHIALPKSVVREHDKELEVIQRRTLRQRMKETEKQRASRRKQFLQRAEDLKKMSWEYKGMTIYPAPSEEALIDEGASLHHCVATYAKAIAAGSTAIFFIRRLDAPQDSWYTLELNEKKLEVKQNRGKYNCARTPEVEEFEEAWVAHLRAMPSEQKGMIA